MKTIRVGRVLHQEVVLELTDEQYTDFVEHDNRGEAPEWLAEFVSPDPTVDPVEFEHVDAEWSWEDVDPIQDLLDSLQATLSHRKNTMDGWRALERCVDRLQKAYNTSKEA